MSIEQHAEAAAIDKHLDWMVKEIEAREGVVITPSCREIIKKNMQAAMNDENHSLVSAACVLMNSRTAMPEFRDIEDYNEVPDLIYDMIERVESEAKTLRARIEALEGLGPLIADLIQAVSWREYSEVFVRKAFPEADAALTELVNDIRAILEGGAPEQCAEIAKGGGA